MKILLTGATGFLGYRTLEKLINEPEIQTIVATGRNLLDYRKIAHEKVQYQMGELEDIHFAKQITEGVNMIVNTASLSAPWGNRTAFIQANLNTQYNLLHAAKERGIERFIYISSPSIYYNGKSRLDVKESEPLPKKFVNEYARTKHEAEQLLIKHFSPFIILRPRALIGRGDSIIMPRLIKAVSEKRLKVIGKGNNIVDLTSVSNVADAIILALKAPKEALNQAYNITNGEPVKLWDQIALVLKQLNLELSANRIPFTIVDNIARLLEIKSRLTNNQEPTLTRYGVGTLAKSFTLDISKARELLGYKPAMKTESAINEFVNWYIQHEKL
jgi:nucleoside-diphosphate-sugar epimerase